MLVVIHVNTFNIWTGPNPEQRAACKNLRLMKHILQVFYKPTPTIYNRRSSITDHFLSDNNIVIDKANKKLYIDYVIFSNKVYNISNKDTPTPEDFKNFFFEAIKILS